MMHLDAPEQMIRRFVKRLRKGTRTCQAMIICLLFCSGCSSLQPTTERREESASKPWTGAQKSPSYPLAEGAAGLLDLLK
jgi:hypothetical protein